MYTCSIDDDMTSPPLLVPPFTDMKPTYVPQTYPHTHPPSSCRSGCWSRRGRRGSILRMFSAEPEFGFLVGWCSRCPDRYHHSRVEGRDGTGRDGTGRDSAFL